MGAAARIVPGGRNSEPAPSNAGKRDVNTNFESRWCAPIVAYGTKCPSSEPLS
jgi:hypothetical protein